MTKRFSAVCLAAIFLLAGCTPSGDLPVPAHGEADRDFYLRLGQSSSQTCTDRKEDLGITGVLHLDFKSIQGEKGVEYSLLTGVSGSWELDDPSWEVVGCRVEAACLGFDPATQGQWNIWEPEGISFAYEVAYPQPVAKLKGSVVGARAVLHIRREEEEQTVELETFSIRQAALPDLAAWLAEGQEPFAAASVSS